MPERSTIELVGRCRNDTGQQVRHRVWLTPDGRVLTPDHDHGGYEDERVLAALGGEPSHLCTRWAASDQMHDSMIRPLKPVLLFPPPDLDSWKYTSTVGAWTSASQSAANMAVLGFRDNHPVPPELTLGYTQLFLAHGAPMPKPIQWAEHLYMLAFPSTRGLGWKRCEPTPLDEVRDLLESNIDPSLIAPLAALALPPSTAAQAAEVFNKYGLPHSLLIPMANAAEPAQIERMLRTVHSTASAKELIHNVSRLRQL